MQYSLCTKPNNDAFFAILVASSQTIDDSWSWENAQQGVTGIALAISNINLRIKQTAASRRKCSN